jgi:uncharacterized protein (TIGR02246 family)
MDDDLRARLERMEGRAEIHDLVTRYGLAIDDRDFDALGDLFAVDGVFDNGVVGKRVEGRKEVISFYRQTLAPPRGPTFHYANTHLVDFADDDRNRADGVVTAHAELAMGGKTVLIALRYLDAYVQEDGRWRFLERRLRFLYAMSLEELKTGLAESKRLRWPGREQWEADLPETLDTWRRFVAGG